jgi:hypothetical protein
VFIGYPKAKKSANLQYSPLNKYAHQEVLCIVILFSLQNIIIAYKKWQKK